MSIRRALALSVLVIVVVGSAQAAEPIRADWLYLTGDGAWIQRSYTLDQAAHALPLPVDQLQAERFWWRAEQPDIRLSWQSPPLSERLTENAVVQVDDWPGSWTLVQTEPDLLILAQSGVRRALPRGQWHRLSWVAGKHQSSGFELRVRQGEARTNPFEYAWFDPAISGEVRYSLTLESDSPALRQQLVLHNQSAYPIEAPGFSFAQHRDGGPKPQARTMQTLSAESEPAGPMPGDSSGQATLQSKTPLTLRNHSHRWLAVQTFPLASVEHQYQFNWTTQSTSSQSGRWSLALTAEQALPALAGQVQVAVWDRQVGLLEGRYQPQGERTTRLDLGPSDQVTLTTESTADNRWRLTLTNRNDFAVNTRIELSHWQRQRREQASAKVAVSADDSVTLNVRLDTDGLSVQPR